MSRVVVALTMTETAATAMHFAEAVAAALQHDVRCLRLGDTTTADTVRAVDLADELERIDASMVVAEIAQRRDIQPYLNACRNLRVPYLFVRSGNEPKFSTVALPVTFLPEEKEKGPFAAAFGRFFHAKLVIFRPKDYGTRAARNIEAMKTLFDSFSLDYEEVNARKDSDGVEREAAVWAQQNADLTIVSASREYGLDDLIFGSKERKILEKTTQPVLLVNPRGDLYALCD